MHSAALYREHGKAVTAANRKLHDADALVDVTVTVGDVAFPCHRSLLAAWSGFFRSMFSSNFTEKHSSHVTLVETGLLSAEAFEVLHTWMYRGELNLTIDSVELILPAAFYLQMDKTVDMLTDYTKRQYCGNVPVTRICSHLNLAHTWGMPHLRSIALEGMARKFDDLVKVEQLLELNPEDFLMLLGMDQLNVESEDVVFNAAFAWLHQSEDRLDHLPDVLKLLRFGLVSVGTIRKALDVKIMSKDSECCGILLDVLAARDSHVDSLQLLQRNFSGMFVERTGPQANASDSDDTEINRDQNTLYGGLWRDAYANLGDSRPDMGDLTVTVDGQDFHCHKAVLFGWSEYFSRRFLVNEDSADRDGGSLKDVHRPENVQPRDQPSSPTYALKCPSGENSTTDTDVRPTPTMDMSEQNDEMKSARIPGDESATSDPDGAVVRDADPEKYPHRGPGAAMVGQWRDSSSHISLTGDCVTKNTVDVLLDWIYRGQLKVTAKNLCDVMKCARCLQMDGVVQVVKKYFESYWPTLSDGEVITMLHAAKKYDLAHVYETCFNQIVAKFEQIRVNLEFKELLDIETFLRLLRDDRLNAASEDVVLQAALSWLRHSECRLVHISDIIKSVRLGLVGKATLSDGLDLAFHSRNAEINAILKLAMVKEPWSRDSLEKDHPSMYRRRQRLCAPVFWYRGKAFYDRLTVTCSLGSTDEGEGRLEHPRGVCVLGELTLVADYGTNRLVAFIRHKITGTYYYLCHITISNPLFCVADADRDLVYVCCNYAITMVKWTESKGLHVVGRLTAEDKLRDPRHMAMAPGDPEHVYVACEDAVLKVSVTTDTVVTRLGRPTGVGERPISLALIGSVIMVQYGQESIVSTPTGRRGRYVRKNELHPEAIVIHPDMSSSGRIVKPAGLKKPVGVGADGDNFLVGDLEDKCVYVVTPSGETLTTVNTGGVAPVNISVYGANIYVVPYDSESRVHILA